MGRRRLLLFTIFGQAIFTLPPPSRHDYPQFVWAQFFTRIFGYAEEMLCFVVIAEEIAARRARLGQWHPERLVLSSARAWRRWSSRPSMSCPMAGARFM